MSAPVGAPRTDDGAEAVVLAPLRWWHIERCAALERELFPADAWSAEGFWSEVAHVPDTRHYLVALRGEQVLGYAGLSALPPEADVQTLAVAPAAQGSGLGGRLLDALLAEARRRGCTSVLLEVHADNEPALALYARRGFTALSRRRDYYAPGADAVVMRARLGGRGAREIEEGRG